jgi:hypothetical protein
VWLNLLQMIGPNRHLRNFDAPTPLRRAHDPPQQDHHRAVDGAGFYFAIANFAFVARPATNQSRAPLDDQRIDITAGDTMQRLFGSNLPHQPLQSAAGPVWRPDVPFLAL